MKRKDFLKNIGAIGVSLPLLGFATDKLLNDPMDEPSNNDLLFDCDETPSETAGPYPTPSTISTSTLVRSDITENSQAGIPLTLTITLLGTSSCAALGAGYRIDIWHCNKRGYYSAYSGQPGIDGTQNTTGETWLRGIQYTDSNGQVTFTSIYPGWYTPRATHIHVQVYDASNNLLLTTQLAFPDSTNTTVNNYYNTSGTNSFTNATDMVFSDSYTDELMTVTGSTSAGYTATANVYVASTLGLNDFSAETGGQFSMLVVPNPVTEKATIHFNLLQSSQVSVEIVDIQGRRITMLEKESFANGENSIPINVSDLKAGTYFYKLTVSNINGDFSQTKEFIKK